MWCTICGNHLSECTCPDIDKRMASLQNASGVMYKMCRICGKHYERCTCENPDFTTSHDGIELKDIKGYEEDTQTSQKSD